MNRKAEVTPARVEVVLEGAEWAVRENGQTVIRFAMLRRTDFEMRSDSKGMRHADRDDDELYLPIEFDIEDVIMAPSSKPA